MPLCAQVVDKGVEAGGYVVWGLAAWAAVAPYIPVWAVVLLLLDLRAGEAFVGAVVPFSN